MRYAAASASAAAVLLLAVLYRPLPPPLLLLLLLFSSCCRVACSWSYVSCALALAAAAGGAGAGAGAGSSLCRFTSRKKLPSRPKVVVAVAGSRRLVVGAVKRGTYGMYSPDAEEKDGAGLVELALEEEEEEADAVDERVERCRVAAERLPGRGRPVRERGRDGGRGAAPPDGVAAAATAAALAEARRAEAGPGAGVVTAGDAKPVT